MNWSGLIAWLVANAGNIVAAIMVLWHLILAAISAAQGNGFVNGFLLRRK